MIDRLTVTGSILMACMPLAVAHHSSAIYDTDTQVYASGTVTDWHTGQPHFSLTFTGTDESGEENSYVLDFGGVSALVRQNGWDESTFQVGDSIAVTGFPSRLKHTNLLVEFLYTEFGEFQAPPRRAARNEAGSLPPRFGRVPEEITLPSITMYATVTGSDWVDPTVVVHVHGEPQGEPARDFEIHLPGAAALADAGSFTAEDFPVGTPVIVTGLLADDGDREVVFAWILGAVEGRAVRTQENGLRLAHEHLGLEFTPAPDGGSGPRGPGGDGGPPGRGPSDRVDSR